MRHYIFILLLLVGLGLHAQNRTVSGYITDLETGETLIGATVVDAVSGKGVVSNIHGFYSLTLPEGEVALEFSYVSYQTRAMRLLLEGNEELNIALTSATKLDEVTVVANRGDLGVKGSQMSAIEVPVEQIKNIPALAGEVDVIKALQLMPGVQSGSEGATGLYIRGGGPDQNLIMLDGVPLYNINHLFGFFSVFNADAIKNVTMYKGNFPARFGSRLSGVVDVRQNEGNNQKIGGTFSLGLLSTKLSLEGPIASEKTTFNVSARRTYFDALAQPIMAAMQAGKSEKTTAGYYFYDLNAKVTHRFSHKDKLSASFYMGNDAIYMNHKTQYGKGDDMRMKFGWNWGNLLGALNWGHQFSNTVYSNLTASYTRYRYKVGIEAEEEVEKGKPLVMTMDYSSHIQDVGLVYDFDYTPNPNHAVKFGANYVFHNFVPEVGSTKFDVNDPGLNFQDTVGGSTIYTHEAAVYVEDNWSICRVVKLNMGLRGSLYAVQGKVYPSVEPRVGLRTLITDDLSFKASYAYMSQYIHLLSNSNITMPTDLWVPVTGRLKPMQSQQVSAGLFYNLLDVVDLSVEGYYKGMNNIIEYKDGASFFGASQGWEDKVVMGEGWSYGVELLAQKNVGKFTGWLGYTWSKSERLFDREGMVLNDGKPFFAKYDRRHDVSVVAQYKFNDRIDIASTFVYGTGTRATLGTQEYYYPESYSYPLEHIPERNNYTMPYYMRVDFGINFHKKWKKRDVERTWNVSVYNLTNRMNPFMIYDGYDGLEQLTIFPLIPSVSYSLKF